MNLFFFRVSLFQRKGKYGTGLVFLPKDEKKQQAILSIMIEEIEREGLSLMHLCVLFRRILIASA
jgi:hypothetical protein